jgi:hypothetical protein
VTKVQYANGAPASTPILASKTTSYTVTDADRWGSVRFAGLSADATLTLPAAAGRAGFLLYVSNEDTGFFGVTVDPNSTELIDGFSTRKGFAGTRITLLCDGTGWRTVSGRWRFISSALTPTSGGTSGNIAHGLGVTPVNVTAQMTCVTGEGNFTAGDILHLGLIGDAASPGVTGLTIVKDATNLQVLTGSNSIVIANKTTRASFVITAANWAVRVIAED